MLLPLRLCNENCEETIKIKALLDTGAGGRFIDQNYARKFETHDLDEPIKVYNVDGTENKRGTIRQYVNLSFSIGAKQFKEKLYVTGLGKQKIILGFPWIQEHNPLIDWKKGTIEWRMKEPRKMVFQWRKKKIEEEMKKEDTSMMDEPPKLIQVMETMEPEEEIWINAKTNLAMDLAI